MAVDCFRVPVPELAEAANNLSQAVEAHLRGDTSLAAKLISASNTEVIREWVESLWGKQSPYVRKRAVEGAPPVVPKAERAQPRMPPSEMIVQLHERDGFHCRFCGLPVIRDKVRARIHEKYPAALPWGRRNIEQHAAFQAMWAQYDHVVPWTRGGRTDLENLVVTCAPCNFARMEYTLEEVGLNDPRTRAPVRSTWDGLERFK